ncbi:uncharacterized protein At3g49140 isoform X2 [Phalaenopsis equestris]|uniref:uncharacterized protein At3g49140 isoform X2 n=1 Tax=Phalaenopsis equestris TaxID=78828 RepID=UPI0009E32AD8|nr:uncharacterized protein At3g49140 isoform X2 [Phalaenopsis equestris]
MSTGTAAAWISSFDGRRSSDNSGLRCRTPTIGALQSFWHSSGHYLVASKIQVAADYSDSAADFSKYVGNEHCHPLEELKCYGKGDDVLLADCEIARTTVEANSKALLVFPGRAHCEPHRHISWAEAHYVIDDYGDMFFELFDDENILKEHSSSNPVNVLIGMDFPVHGESRLESDSFFDYMDNDIINVVLDDDYEEIVDTDITDTLIKWGMPETLRHIHPIYFAKFLAKSFHSKHKDKMDYPTNGLSIMGYLRPAFVDEESYLWALFHRENDDDYVFDWRDESEKEEEQMAGMHGLIDREILNFSSRQDRSNLNSTFYKLEIMSMELFSVYGDQSTINLQDFQDAEPDVLAHCASAIMQRFCEDGKQFVAALKALCRKKKGLVVEGANIIGVDSLGIDVRVFFGLEAKTIRISFNARKFGSSSGPNQSRTNKALLMNLLPKMATTETSAEKKIRRMLFPHYHRKKSRSPGIGVET